jgi:flagellar protein FlgJ
MPSLAAPKPFDAKADDEKLRSTFQDFVGQTLFGETLKAMRKTQNKPAYFHGGRAEEIFQQQLDQVLAEKLSRASADQLAGPMFELFTLSRK